ncbi:MAG: alpha/beta fold hydrolase [Planctomycetales bacterium]
MTSRRIDVDGVHLAVFEAGEGEPLLFVHGFPLNHESWRPQLDEFSRTHRVIAPDLRGFGGSDVTAGTATMERFADDLRDLLDALGVVEPVTFCGLSMGGYIAWQFAHKHPGRLRRLVLCDTKAAADSDEAKENRHRMAETALAHGAAAIAKALEDKLFAEATRRDRPEVVAMVRRMIEGTDPEGIAAALRGMAERPDMSESLEKVEVPTLLIVGVEDALTPPAEMKRMAIALMNAQLVQIADAGHLAPLENPEPVNAAIRKFLEETE